MLKLRFFYRTCALIVLIHGAQCFLYGQRLNQGHISHVKFPDVYGHRFVNDVAQDQAGLIWIASDNGLYWYDGVECSHYTNAAITLEKTGKVYRVMEDDKNHLWVLGKKGLFLLDKHRTQCINPIKLGLPDSIVLAPNLNFCRGNGQDLFVLAGSVIYLWGKSKLTVWARYPRPAISTKERAVMLFSKKENQLYWYFPDQWSYVNRIFIYRPDGQIVDLWKVNIQSEHGRDSIKNHFWFKLTDAFADSVTIYSEIGPSFETKLTCYPRCDTSIKSLREYRLGQSWAVAAYGEFIERFRPELSNYNTYPAFPFRLSGDMYALACPGALLLYQTSPKKFQYLQPTLGHQIRAIREDKFGHLIFGSYSGTKYLHKKGGVLRSIYNNAFACHILPTDINQDRFVLLGEGFFSTLYFLQSTPKGVSIIHTQEYPDGKGQTPIYSCMAPDPSLNGVWHIKHRNYLSFYDFNTRQSHTFMPPLAERAEREMVVTQEGIWLIGQNGLKLFSKPDFATHTYQDRSHQLPEQLKNLSINTLYLDKVQNLWIGTNKQGLFRYHTAQNTIARFSSMEGLAESTVYSILAEAGDSILWLGTGKGLSRFDLRRRWFDNYYVEDGLSNNEFNTMATFRAPDGTMYMGGQDGINYFHPDSFQTDPQHLQQFALIALKDHDNTNSIQQYVAQAGDTIVVPPSVKWIEVGFRANDYFHTAQLQYRYRIVGVIEQWESLRYYDKAIFPLLPPGEHILEAQVRSYRGMWLPPARYTLHVLPPWYATWWFKTLVAMAFGGALYGLYRLRIRQLKREFSLRQQIAHDLHDSLGSRMFLLHSLVNQVLNPLTLESKRKEFLKQLDVIGQDSFKSIREFIWAFDPTQDEVGHLFERMENFAENYLVGLIPDGPYIHCPALPSGLKLRPRAKHHLMNVYQELLTNMVKHTHSQKIEIDLQVKQQQLLIKIQNWHTGLQQKGSDKQDSLQVGYNSMRLRLQEIGAELTWKEPEAGKQEVLIGVRLY